ncbi:hypothetical protein BDV25DRAFT_167578 [Aspergillus avenaceus]|uniref:Uncharacterized protein n=1 Tax=Aspergillus avenaceus TaxID=36643 RepID=A0A5N6TD02_ASPAV|nr:hypothetical protein BDV25DRAFT_167578 [Aspergillus avenaceus]
MVIHHVICYLLQRALLSAAENMVRNSRKSKSTCSGTHCIILLESNVVCEVVVKGVSH